VQATDYKFAPPAVTVKANQEVQITLSNGAGQAHNWTVQGLDQQYTTGDVQGGKAGSVSFTPSKTGTFKVVCTIAGHESFGMVGQLIVQ
jgi:plastocyanin